MKHEDHVIGRQVDVGFDAIGAFEDGGAVGGECVFREVGCGERGRAGGQGGNAQPVSDEGDRATVCRKTKRRKDDDVVVYGKEE